MSTTAKKRQPATFVWAHLPSSGLVFLPEADARWLASTWDAILAAQTWGELRKLAPPDAYEAIEQSHLDNGEGEEIDDGWRMPQEASFEPPMMPNWETGEFPGWVLAWMRRSLPDEVKAAFGENAYSMASGEAYQLGGADAAAVVTALEALGHACRHDPELMRKAAPFD